MNDIVLNTLPENEILRYLGCPPDDENTLALVRPCAEDLCKTARPRTLRRAFPITVQEEGVVIGENALFLPGQDLVRVLIGCSRAVLFCATLGSAVDSMLRKEQLCDMTRSVILDSCASVAIEAVCDQIEEAVRCRLSECLSFFAILSWLRRRADFDTAEFSHAARCAEKNWSLRHGFEYFDAEKVSNCNHRSFESSN